MIWVGTSGFQYPEWKGTFYPEKLSTAKMLPYYSGRFSTTEINYSFYRIPSEKTLTKWFTDTPAEFRFAMKAPQEITHARRLRDCAGVLERFCAVLKALGGKLGPVLFQLPPFQRGDVALLRDFLATLPAELHSAFEFRHASWFNDEVYDVLRSKNAALCVADTEKLTTPIVATAGFGYFRLRNPAYTKADIARWAKVVRDTSERTGHACVYFKHEESGVGPKFARQLLDALGIAPPRTDELIPVE